jgi:NAD-dependent SIR2 family protein deacetylase
MSGINQGARQIHNQAGDVSRQETSLELEQSFENAAKLLRDADSVLIAAGAGMGVDSGLPDFRGSAGLWNGYSAALPGGRPVLEAATLHAFEREPTFAWGFYGHRLDLYRRTMPHDGFRLLRLIGETMEHGMFVFTSNVDGQFQKAGFHGSRICEYHGSLHHLQCLEACNSDIWSANNFMPVIDASQCQLVSPLPACRHCGALARPNVLMFSDWNWNPARKDQQERDLMRWLKAVRRMVVIELGAGTAIPAVRVFSGRTGRPVIRINPDEAQLGGINGVSLPLGALEAVTAIAHRLGVGPPSPSGLSH